MTRQISHVRESKFQILVDQYLLAFPEEQERLSPLNQLLSDATDQEVVSRNHRVGHLTASGFVVSPARDQLLLIHHKKLQRLLQPGGHMEPTDATPLDAAMREVAEETGLTSLTHIPYHADQQIPIDIDIHSIPARGDEPEHLHHDFRYLFVCHDDSEFLVNENEIEGIAWYPIREVMKQEMFKWLKPKLERILT
jgi:8-oxo-dGTP pyrophosphatase MutT (NUDIX family)